MVKTKRLKMSVEVISDLLPDPPEGFTYEVEQFSPLVYRVWIVNHSIMFSYTSEPVKSVWGFVKSTGDVVLPKNHLKITSTKEVKSSLNSLCALRFTFMYAPIINPL